MDMTNMKIGDIIEYNGFINTDYLHIFEKHFIKNNMSIGEPYEILDIDNNCFNTGITWYYIKCDNNLGYWIPFMCFNNRIDMKKKYGLK